MDLIPLLMFLRSYFDGEVEVVEVVVIIASICLDAVELERVLLKGDIVRDIYWLGLLGYLYITNL